jgi:hypothetical protein
MPKPRRLEGTEASLTSRFWTGGSGERDICGVKTTREDIAQALTRSNLKPLPDADYCLLTARGFNGPAEDQSAC